MSYEESRFIEPPKREEAVIFCDLCQYIFSIWVTYSNLLENIPESLEKERGINLNEFLETPPGRCMRILNSTTLEHLILQIAKLHDPVITGKNENLCIDLFVSHLDWSNEEKTGIKKIREGLFRFYEFNIEVRNKILAHNDRGIFRTNASLGSFPRGEDEKYFSLLAEFCTLIWNRFHTDANMVVPQRVFEFLKYGLERDNLCPSNDARILRSLIVDNISP